MKVKEYREACLEKRLIPFIDKHRNRDNVLFWPDLAIIRYENSVQTLINRDRINFVSKNSISLIFLTQGLWSDSGSYAKIYTLKDVNPEKPERVYKNLVKR